MAKFKYVGKGRGQQRVLVDAGGPKMIDGVMHPKRPAIWADFSRNRDKIVELKSPAQVKVMLGSPRFGKDYVLLPEMKRTGVKK